ncbi:MAG: rRNA maturation RNase YbeY [Deltaproteobacteria bacterium]|jgi:rRNA maturation RNase YbeY|nr:rRNA maturation RNase YbeY [Deltaproteobacteria bacterium]
MPIFIADDLGPGPAGHCKLRRRLARLLRELGRGGASLTVLLTDDEAMRELNRTHRSKDKSTNVLSFPDTDLALGQRDYLGDVALSLPYVEREAAERGLEASWLFYFYLVHGLLHLMGHDHELGREAYDAQDAETARLLALIRTDW